MAKTRQMWLAGCSLALAAALSSPSSAEPPAGPALLAWVSHNTDIPPAQIALAGPENVYSLELLGPPAATGEVIALVRTEAFDSGWGATHGFQSWEANLLIDCKRGRLKVIRSASYAGRNRQGRASEGPADADWTTPTAGEPSAKLVSAACDTGFAWPLRQALAMASASATKQVSSAAASAGSLPEVVEIPGPSRPPPPAAKADAKPDAKPDAQAPAKTAPVQQVVDIAPAAAPKVDAPTPAYAVQLGHGPSEEGAKRALAKAKRILKTDASSLTEAVQESEIPAGRHRYTASLAGFATAEAAQTACVKIQAAKLDCLARRAAEPSSAPAEASPTAAAGGAGSYFVQITRGPSEAGARKALEKARATLGPAAEGLTARMDATDLGGKQRYTARLEGFPSEAAAEAACGKLAAAGQSCFFRPEQTASR